MFAQIPNDINGPWISSILNYPDIYIKKKLAYYNNLNILYLKNKIDFKIKYLLRV